MDDANSKVGNEGESPSLEFKLEGGLFAAILEDAGKVEIYLRDPNPGKSHLINCTVLAVDRDAILVTTPAETLLIPIQAIQCIKLAPEGEYVQRWQAYGQQQRRR
jgi:hypothetical protein